MKNIKNLVAAVLCITLVFISVFGVVAAEPDSIAIGKIGDTDNTDVVTVKDATRIQKYLVNLISFSETAKLLADVNDDNKVTIKDASEIQKWISECSDNTLINSLFYCKAYSLAIRTVDADTGNTLGGCSFGIYADRECTLLLEDVICGISTGNAMSSNKYPTGTYYLKQHTVASNYEPDSLVYEIKVSEDNSVTDCVWTVIRNKMSPKRILIKTYDEDNYNPESPLSGAVFGVYSDKECSQQVSTINGQFSEKEYVVGNTYYIKQLFAPDGYSLNNTVYEVTIPNAQYLDIVAVIVFNTK